MIIYTCPKCGGELTMSVIDTFPPIHVVECHKCGYKDEQIETVSKVEYIPYNDVAHT